MKLSVISLSEGTSVDGPGLRTSIYFAGCSHHCRGCHNPQTWNIGAGTPTDIEQLLKIIEYNDFNVTFSGGDPLFQAEAVAELAVQIKQRLGKNIWCYTGYLWENIKDDSRFHRLLENIDVLVDGPFIESLRDTSLRFRGSSNQRFIDVQVSLDNENPVQIEI